MGGVWSSPLDTITYFPNWIRWNSRTLWLLLNTEYFIDASYRELSHCRFEASEEEFASCSCQSGTNPDLRTEFKVSDFFLSSFFSLQLCLSVFLSLKKMTQKFPQSSNWYAWDGPSLPGRGRHWECVLEACTRRQGSLGEGGRNATALETWWKQRLMAAHISLVLWVPTMNAGSCFWLTSSIHHCVTWISHLNTLTLPFPSHLPHPNKRSLHEGWLYLVHIICHWITENIFGNKDPNCGILKFVLLPGCSSLGNVTDRVSRFSVFNLPGKELLTFSEHLGKHSPFEH